MSAVGRVLAVGRRARSGEYSHLAPRHVAHLAYLYTLDRIGRRRYRMLSPDELLATRSCDTAFVFGSGRSLVDIPPDEWVHISACNTISLREFPRQRWVRADYHLTSEVDFIDEYAARIRQNPLYACTVFVVQGGFLAERGNEVIGRRLLRSGACVFRFRRASRGRAEPPTRRLRDGLTHGFSTIFDAVNLAFLLGYRRIVLAGVDLYNKEYFWLPAGAMREYEKATVDPARGFAGAEAIVAMLGDWHDLLAVDGIELSVYDPRSLAALRLPVFSW